ncbi:tautomerase family protein [Aspergillus affinis]|uniref:tautomerase family protein n=1 Tax=Aspergillus affinis TaxID=1070780 RepID=UPI0022FE1CA6|nr:Tautomerase protein [Aspergillus affinis]KAI9040115.1 Tautomerase protein [Aspergillus affinis]
MPVWSFKYSQGALSKQDKVGLAKEITQLYSSKGLPAFYVNVQFFEMGSNDMLVGGEYRSNFVNLSIVHIARTFKTETDRLDFLKQIDLILERFKTKGLDWEYFIVDAPRQQWKINGMYPPLAGSTKEKEWVRLNRPIQHDRAHLPSLL